MGGGGGGIKWKLIYSNTKILHVCTEILKLANECRCRWRGCTSDSRAPSGHESRRRGCAASRRAPSARNYPGASAHSLWIPFYALTAPYELGPLGGGGGGKVVWQKAYHPPAEQHGTVAQGEESVAVPLGNADVSGELPNVSAEMGASNPGHRQRRLMKTTSASSGSPNDASSPRMKRAASLRAARHVPWSRARRITPPWSWKHCGRWQSCTCAFMRWILSGQRATGHCLISHFTGGPLPTRLSARRLRPLAARALPSDPPADGPEWFPGAEGVIGGVARAPFVGEPSGVTWGCRSIGRSPFQLLSPPLPTTLVSLFLVITGRTSWLKTGLGGFLPIAGRQIRLISGALRPRLFDVFWVMFHRDIS